MKNEEIHQNIEAQREWLMAYKKNTNQPWSHLAQQIGIAQGTISQFGSSKGYAGDEEKIATAISRFRAKLENQKIHQSQLVEIPTYFETPTSSILMNIFSFAQLGNITAAAMGAGLGKTETAHHYKETYGSTYIVTISPSSATPSTMIAETLREFGVMNPKGTTHKRASLVKDMMAEKASLVVFDECQHLSTESFEEIRSWHDKTRVGIAFLGNYSMMARIEGRGRSSDFAQIFSRLGLKHSQNVPERGDALALADAWGFDDPNMREFIFQVSQKPGGLRGVTHMIQLASMFVRGEKSEMTINSLKEAWAQLSSTGYSA